MKSSNPASEKYYGEVAESYDSMRSSKPAYKSDQLDLECYLSQHTKLDAIYLDIPCGTGRAADLIVNSGGHYIGMDISEDMIKVLQRTSRVNTITKIGDMLNIPMEDKSVDYVISIKGLKWLTNESMVFQALSEFSRVAREGAFINLKIDYYRRKKMGGYVLHAIKKFFNLQRRESENLATISLDKSNFERMVANLGFNIIEVRVNRASSKVHNYFLTLR